MGLGGTCHRALGSVAVSGVLRRAAEPGFDPGPRYARSGWQRSAALLSLAALALAFAGCTAVGGIAGSAAAISTGAVTGNPAIGIGVGIAVQASTDAGIQYATRKWQQAEQDAIAAEVGGMTVGETRPWAIKHPIPYENEHGEVQVTELIKNPLTDCKRLLFSVVAGKGAAATSNWYATTACRQDDRWKWAAAEPAVARWGNLQ